MSAVRSRGERPFPGRGRDGALRAFAIAALVPLVEGKVHDQVKFFTSRRAVRESKKTGAISRTT